MAALWRRPSTREGLAPRTDLERRSQGEEGSRRPEGAGARRTGHRRAARGPRAGPARDQHHGVHQGLQRTHRGPARLRRAGRDHGLRGPILHVRDEGAAGRRAAEAGRRRRIRLGPAEPREGGTRVPRPGARDRADEDGRPQCHEYRAGHEDHRGDRPFDGNRGGLTMPRHGKKYREAAKLVEAERRYAIGEAAELLPRLSISTFDGPGGAHLGLGVDPRHADQLVRGTVVLPHGTGKVTRVAVFAQGEKAQEALRAGADEVGGEDLVKKIEAGWLDFDVALATPDLMGQVGRLGKILGRRGLMPNPKAGTITFDLDRAVREVKGGRVEYKVDKTAIVHVPFGKSSFEADALVANLAALVDAINRARPSGAKGQYLKGLTIASTMGPGIRVDIPAVLAAAAAA